MCPPTNSAMATAISKTKHLDSSNTLSSKSPTQSVGNSNIDSNKGVSNMFMNMPYTMFHASSSPNDESVQNSHPLTKNTTTKSQENGSTSRPHDKLSMNTTASVRDTISSASGSIVKSAAPQISEEFTSLSYEPPTNTDSALNAALNQVARSNTFSSPTCSFTNGTQSSIAATSTLLAPPTSASHNDISSSVAQTPSSGFLSISQLTANTSCSLSLNEFLTSPTMSEIPSAVVNVNNDSNSANSPFSSIANYFSSSPDPHLPIQSSRVFCESGRNGTSYSASVNKSSNPVCNQGFNSSLSQQPVIDNNFDKQDTNVFTPFDQNMGSLPSTRPSAAPLANNNQTTCVNSSNQMPLTNQITNADTNNQNLMNQHNQPTLSSHDPNLKTGDQMNYLNNFCSVDASQNNRSNGMNSQNSSSSSPMVNFHNNVSHPVANLNHSVSPGKQSMNSPAQSHCSASVSQGKNQNNMNKNHHVKESINSGGGSMNCGPIWQPSGDLNFQQPMMPQIIPNMKHNKQISNKDTSGFPCRNWGHEDEFFVNSMGYPLNQSRSPSNYRASSVSLQSPQSTVSPNTTQSATVRHSPISDINKINQSPKASNVYPSPAGGTQDQNRTYSGQTSQKSNYCLNSGYHRASQSALSSTYSAEALIGDSSRSCSQSLQTSQPFSSVNKNIPHSAESLLPTTSVSNMNTNMPPSTFNFQSINPVVSSHSNSANHFSPGLGLIPRPRFPGFPVPGHNSNHVMNPVGSRSSNLPVEDGISFRWAHPRLPPPPPIPVATSYQSNSRMSAPITNKSPHINSQNKTRTQKPSSTQSLPVTSNQYQFQSYSNQTNQPVTVSNPSSSSKSRSSRNTVAKTSKTKNSSTSKKGKQSASLSSTFQSSSTLEEINLSGSIFEPNRSITPFFGVPNFSPPRTDTPTYLPNNIMNTSHRSQEHNSSTVSTSICNTFTSPLFPPRCQSNLNLNFQQSSGSFGVNTIHPHAVQNQMSIAATSGTPNSITSHFNVSNLLPDPNNSSPSVPSTNLAPIKFHHGNHIAPPSAGSQQSGESLSHPGSTTPHMYNSLGALHMTPRQANHHMQIGPMAPSLVHPPPGHSGPFNNVLPSLNFSVDDH
ncbi:hypothetical protein GQR58_022794 [Nymphon striatum]|nr:hypothetical protein GQR58_022794 [Nymphon striatum]